MQRTLTTLGLILSLLMCGCDDVVGANSDETSDRFCSLPDTTLCTSYLGGDATSPDVEGADAGVPGVYDAATLFPDSGSSDAGIDFSDASVGQTDAGTADAGGEGAVSNNPCVADDCAGPSPVAVTCGDGTASNVSCQPSFFGACEWHFVCGTP